MPSWKRPVLIVLFGALATLAVATAPTPLWDEDEARFAAIARTMVETGDWVVPMFNGDLAVDKPVLMHWCMAACMKVFGINEFAARLPSVIATLLTALALFRAGRRWFDDTTGVVAALAYVGCLLVSIEAHAATPDAILTALTAWATLLVAEAVMPGPDGRPDAEKIRALMFTFTDLLGLLPEAIQAIIRTAEKRDLALALKPVDDEVKQKFFSAMTERAAKLMREEMQSMGPVRARDCEEAQANLVRVAKTLADRGEIILIDPRNDDGLVY